MFDALLEATALPNLHPALVHFPIALTAVALLFDAIVFARRRWVSLDASGAFLWVLAAAGAGATYLAGEQAAEEAGLLESAAEVALGKHADAALSALIALSLFALFRVWLAWRDRGRDRAASGALRAFGLVGALAVQGLVAYTGDLGGALVYRHGIAVSRSGAEALAAAPQPDPLAPATGASAPGYLEDGSFVWSPAAGNVSALGETLEPLGPAAVRVARQSPGSEGISLAASGRGNDRPVRLRTTLEGVRGWPKRRSRPRVSPSAGSHGASSRWHGDAAGRLRASHTNEWDGRCWGGPGRAGSSALTRRR